MKGYHYILIFLLSFNSCQTQTKDTPPTSKIVGGPCEGCEAIHEYGDKELSNVDTLPAFNENKPKIKITGTVFKRDMKTPAENVILYVYHTNRKGIYETKGGEKEWARRHGFIRGWIKTGKNGKYTFYTFRPAAYPGGTEPGHIHITVKEPDKNEYYIDDYFFEDDPLLTASKRDALQERGGSGIVVPVFENGIFNTIRDIYLGKNIPGYE